ncbi:hypothetical protein N9B45_02830 [bacterium]|nr:hypothetical protein [bacterium]
MQSSKTRFRVELNYFPWISGGVLARSKRFLFNSGTHCPLVIRIPEKYKHLRPADPGSKVNEIVSFVDMTKTWLNICSAETPDYLQGKVFLGPDAESREYHVSFRGRMDERCDNVRAIRDGKLLYIRNYMPYAPWGQKLNYLWRMKATQAWDQHHREGKTDAVTGRFFGTKPMEELYDTAADPDNIDNLIDDPKYTSDVKRLSKALDQWQVEKFDSGLIPESEVVKRSEDCGKTIYEMVRDPSLYDLRAYQAAAAMALENNPKNLPVFYENLNADDSGVRYWAVVGCFNLQEGNSIDLAKMKACLKDKSHHVQAMAAWILYRAGDQESAQACWNRLLAGSSYASLKVLNIIDWIGDGAEPYSEAMKKCEFSHQGYVPNMKENLGVVVAKPKKKRAP